MATSGTTDFDLNVAQLMEEAYELAGTEGRSGYQLQSAVRSLNLLLVEWQNRGYNFWTVESATIAATTSTATYNLPATIVDVVDAYVTVGSGTTQVDYTMKRLADREYMGLVNKNVESRPTSYWVNRKLIPTMTLWPVPDQAYTITYWRLRRIEDAGKGINTQDVPYRFLPALTAGLAYRIASKTPGAEGRVPYLEAEYEKQFRLATEQDREKVSFHVRAQR